MVKTKKKLLYIIIFLFIFKPLLAEESWYQTAANLHKEWAKTYHTVSDIERYTNIHKSVIGKAVKLKPIHGGIHHHSSHGQVSKESSLFNSEPRPSRFRCNTTVPARHCTN